MASALCAEPPHCLGRRIENADPRFVVEGYLLTAVHSQKRHTSQALAACAVASTDALANRACWEFNATAQAMARGLYGFRYA